MDPVTYAATKKLVIESLTGAGAIKGEKGDKGDKGDPGTTDHSQLTNRNTPEAHNIESISGLKSELDRIPEPVEPLTNSELEEILK